MLRRLLLSSKLTIELKKYAMDALPLESCAILAGSIKGQDVLVSEIIFTKNFNKSRTSFSIEPAELFEAYKKAGEHGLDVVGIFHSHPAPADPSPTDSQNMELNPIPWLIMSTTHNELMASLYDDNKIRKLELIVQQN